MPPKVISNSRVPDQNIRRGSPSNASQQFDYITPPDMLRSGEEFELFRWAMMMLAYSDVTNPTAPAPLPVTLAQKEMAMRILSRYL